MPVHKAPLPIQFSGGVETRQDAKQVPTTKLLDLQNAVFTKQTTLAKRNGYRTLSKLVDGAGTEYGNARGMAARDDELVVFDDFRAYSYRPANDRWSDAGEVSSVVVKAKPIARTGTQQWCPDVATRNGVSVAAWEDSRGGIWCSVVEDASGRILLAQTQLDSNINAISPRCLPVGEVLLVLWVRRDTGRIMVSVVNPATPTTALTSAILTDDLLIANPVYDAEPCLAALNGDATVTSGRPGVIAWAVVGGHRVGYLVSSGVLGSPASGTPSVVTYTGAGDNVTGPIAVVAPKGSALASVVWATDAPIRIRGRFLTIDLTEKRAGNFGGGSGPTYIRLTAGYGADGTTAHTPVLYWAAEVNNGQTDLNQIQCGKADRNDTAFDPNNTVLHGHCLASRAFHDGAGLSYTGLVGAMDGQVYVAVVHGVQFFPYVGVIRLSGATVGGTSTITVARLLPGMSAGAHFRRIAADQLEFISHLPSVEARNLGASDIYSRQNRIPLGVRIQLESSGGDKFGESAISLSELDFDHVAAYQSAQLGRGLYLAGAVPQHYDGDRWTEADYHTAPDVGYDLDGAPINPASSVGALNIGGGLVAGTYQYKLWYEDIDGQGELHPGAVSVGINAVIPADGSDAALLQIPTYRLTNKRRVRICVARSVLNATGTDDTIAFYRVSGLDPALNTGNNRYIDNDPTVDSVSFTDVMTDADLLKQEPLYTNGGTLSNDPAPWSGDVIAVAKSRMYWTDPNDPDLVRFSKTRADDTAFEGPVDFSQRCDPFGGAIVGIWAMDDAIYVGKETAIYQFGGAGPLAAPEILPEQYSFSPPNLVTSDVGCESAASIGPTPIGTLFQTTKGITLLGRDRQVQRIGAPVDAYNAQTIVRTMLMPDRPQILMLTDEGRSLLYDYERGQWSTFTNHEGLDACVVGGVYHYLRTDGRVFVETPGLYRDDNKHIPMLIETAWIKMAGYLQGWQRVLWAYFIGTYKSSHALGVRYRIDYNEAWSTQYLLNVDANYDPALYGEGAYGVGPYGGAGGATTALQRRLHLNQRCQSMQFRIEDIEATDSYGAAFELSELLLIGGVLGPAFMPGAARSGSS